MAIPADTTVLQLVKNTVSKLAGTSRQQAIVLPEATIENKTVYRNYEIQNVLQDQRKHYRCI